MSVEGTFPGLAGVPVGPQSPPGDRASQGKEQSTKDCGGGGDKDGQPQLPRNALAGR